MADPGITPTWKVTKRWLIILGIAVIVPFSIVWGLTSWNYAFGVLTGSASAFGQSGVGPAAAVLAVIGYLAVPVGIGAVASVWFTANVRHVFGNELASQILTEVKEVVASDRSAPQAEGGSGRFRRRRGKDIPS
jgi:hypothetical protein